jgi:cyclopropane-fatty-acyl-phospholipid synthase
VTVDTLIRKNLLPDFLIRWGIRRLLRERLREEGRWETLVERQQRLSRMVQFLKTQPIAVETPAANAQHYEVPTEFYQLALGQRLKYSCGYWPEGVSTLDGSEEAMLKLTCERARVENGQKILDLGCGWGALSLYLAEHYPKCRITGVSNSGTQRAYITSQAKAHRLKNLKVITADMNRFQSAQRFDRVISVEMFEHMRNYEKLMAKIASWLEPGGLLFVHIFTHLELAYLFEAKDEKDWMSRYFFTGGIMPSDPLLLYFQKDLRIADHWRVPGAHYQKTSEEWLKNTDRNKAAILKIFRQAYGPHQALGRWSYWRVFFMACAELWGYAGGNEWIVSHYIFQKPSART